MKPLKKYGQHFLISPEAVQKIVSAVALNPTDAVLEIGPGRGVLTGLLAGQAASVLAVEVDSRLAEELKKEYSFCKNLVILNKDFLKLDLLQVLDHHGIKKLKVVANLPYYIATPILERLFAVRDRIKTIVVMVQREMAQRMAAQPGTDYGSFSVFVQYYARVEKLFDVPPGAFFPPPKVTSTVIRLTAREKPPVQIKDEEVFFKFVQKTFSQRRKMLRAVFRQAFNLDEAGLALLAAKSGIDLSRRPQTLSLPEFARLYECFHEC
ncbi:ribosomal RNA small subunit methyltransferase A [candidate division TA06 bacterium]|uniref:Ribosomal RNA small subunit methyltransferase A n=1 Tax=candidate division TA06 bacterium TaxID=2250710 RepID=A0A933IDU5_UNCT6|nr:ribosomal RNA small subunit methyltransferase A [candidate division TA06 bacterium]